MQHMNLMCRPPRFYADLVHAQQTGSDAIFKQQADVESMCDFILSCVLGRKMQRRQHGAQKDLQQFDSPKKEQTRRGAACLDTAYSSSSDEEETLPKKPVPETTKRKRRGLELLVEDDEMAAPSTSKRKKPQKKGKDKKK